MTASKCNIVAIHSWHSWDWHCWNHCAEQSPTEFSHISATAFHLFSCYFDFASYTTWLAHDSRLQPIKSHNFSGQGHGLRESKKTRHRGSVYLGVNLQGVWEVFYGFQGCVSSAVALYIKGLVETCQVEGVELYRTWIGKILPVVC